MRVRVIATSESGIAGAINYDLRTAIAGRSPTVYQPKTGAVGSAWSELDLQAIDLVEVLAAPEPMHSPDSDADVR